MMQRDCVGKKIGIHPLCSPPGRALLSRLHTLDSTSCRYIPLLAATFTFPQSLGILGGKPGASTYIIGIQDGQSFYCDPHEVRHPEPSPIKCNPVHPNCGLVDF